MADETVYTGEVPLPEGERVGFCQDCGRPLTAGTIKTVGTGVFCEPCLERRLAGGTAGSYGYTADPQAQYSGQAAGQAPWQGASAGYPPAPPMPPPPISLNAPSPALAGFLGLIPGVGAMYNGQFAKGVVHLIVFAVLVSLADNVNNVFGLFVAGWVFFMAFEAYHTARARRDGLPLPDPFGWNNIGERMGFGKGWGFVNTSGTVPPPPAPGNPYTGPTTAADSDWVGYVPPTNFATTPPEAGVPYSASAPFASQAAPGAGYVPYAQTPYPASAPYAQAAPFSPPYAAVSPLGTDPAMMPVPPTRRFPVGAVWLIGLGLLFLLGNIVPDLRISWRWLWPVALALLSVWTLVRRLGFLRRDRALVQPPSLGGVICGLRAPVMLMTLAILLALQAAYILTIGQTWPVIIIVLGTLLILERTVERGAVAPSAPLPSSAVPPVGWASATEPTQPIQPVQGGQ